MQQIITLAVLLVSFYKNEVEAAGLPGPLVYVVTPSPRTPQSEKGRSVPFYYHNWMKRMDTPFNATSTTTTPKTKTPDLIFAEFESNNNNKKSIRKLLEKEKIETTTSTTTTSRPIYVPDEEGTGDSEPNYGLPVSSTEKAENTDKTDYFAYYNNLYNTGHLHSPIYIPPSSSSSKPTTTVPPITTTNHPISNVENIWHIIDSEKYDQNSLKWEEQSIGSESALQDTPSDTTSHNDEVNSNEGNNADDGVMNGNFALPGFSTNPGNGGENESRAIRTESNIRFPYINLKPFQMKSSKNPLNSFSNSKKGVNNMFNLDDFHEVKSPVRGEAQDIVPMRQPVDRYNPAQPYLPNYGTKSKQSSPSDPPQPRPAPPSPPIIAVANLVPPPPPPAPKITADDFPTPSSYESFPPYAPAAPAPRPTVLNPPVSMYRPPAVLDSDLSDDSGPADSDGPPDSSDGPSMDLGYRYKPPAPPVPSFVPTLPPPSSNPFSGYSYDKPPMVDDNPPPMMDMGKKPEFHGYHYSKPEPSSPPDDHPPTYGYHDSPPPSYKPEHDYPELIYDKPHGGMGAVNGGNDMKDSMGMMPPPPSVADHMPPDMDHHGAPADDSGFPHDFPGDFKFHHDFDDHDHHYHHHHTTTTTTEMPRVNRYSYYYLGKKLYYLPLYFSVYFIVYVGALIIKAVLRHKITYPNSFRPNDQTASFFSKRSIESHLSNDNLHEITGRVTRALATAAEKYVNDKSKNE